MSFNIRKCLSKGIKKLFTYAILVLAAILLLFPIVTMLCNSFMESKEVVNTYAFLSGGTQAEGSIGLKLIPDKVTLIQFYNVLMRKPTFLMMFWNSVMITIPSVAGQIVVSVLGAYAFAKLKFPLREPLFFTYIIVMMMPFQVTLVPNFIMLRQLKLLGSFKAVILPGIFSTFGVFLLRQFMVQIRTSIARQQK
jgi:multiple sugar transport system permease protein